MACLLCVADDRYDGFVVMAILLVLIAIAVVMGAVAWCLKRHQRLSEESKSVDTFIVLPEVLPTAAARLPTDTARISRLSIV
eukprot:m.119681 g.119681  ORF g.119681 m.119681 type:complete len:82 (-) comp21807_c0_seq2:440-685(-)